MEILRHDCIIEVAAETLDDGSIEAVVRRDDRHQTHLHSDVTRASMNRLFELIDSHRGSYTVRGGYGDAGGRMMLWLQERG